jgi:PBP1b-binding outer membrane lipoprotein LpoB
VELIRRKLISRLIALTKLRITDRQILNKLLAEQSLSLSGSIDQENAVDIGNLIGVEGFIDGYISMEDNHFILSLNLIETETGEVIWMKTTTKQL